MELGSVLSTQTLPERLNSVEWAVSRTVITSTLTQSPLPTNDSGRRQESTSSSDGRCPSQEIGSEDCQHADLHVRRPLESFREHGSGKAACTSGAKRTANQGGQFVSHLKPNVVMNADCVLEPTMSPILTTAQEQYLAASYRLSGGYGYDLLP